jgi:hypothetical protein
LISTWFLSYHFAFLGVCSLRPILPYLLSSSASHPFLSLQNCILLQLFKNMWCKVFYGGKNLMVFFSIQHGRLKQPQIFYIHHITDLHIRRKFQFESILIYYSMMLKGPYLRGLSFFVAPCRFPCEGKAHTLSPM